MKNYFLSKLTFLMLSSLIIFSSCKKDEEVPMATTQKLSFHMHDVSGNNQISYGTTYMDNTGRNFSISDFRFYLSNIVLIKEDGTEFPLTGKVLLVDPAENEYELGDVPVGKYKGFKFYVGLDSATNHSDPTTYPSSDPLAIQTPGIHWDWNSGYIFILFEGLYDPSVAGTGTPTDNFAFHIGMDANFTLIDISTSAFEVKADMPLEIGLNVDVNAYLNNIDLTTENETHTFNNPALAAKLVSNLPGMFKVE